MQLFNYSRYEVSYRRSFQNACRQYTTLVPKVTGLITGLLCKCVGNTQFPISV